MTDPIWITGILMLGLVFKFVGFAVRDEVWLRALVMAGLGCDALFYAIRSEPVLQSVMTNLLLISINTLLLCLIFIERTTWGLSQEDRAIYRHFPTLTPGQFRKLRKTMRRETVASGTRLLEEGRPVDDLILILGDRLQIEKAGQVYAATGPTFVGEIALLTGNLSSAGVILPDGGEIVRVPLAGLKARMARSPALSNAVVALFSAELALKVTEGAPRPDAPPRTGPVRS
jgi:hypothetical protein